MVFPEHGSVTGSAGEVLGDRGRVRRFGRQLGSPISLTKVPGERCPYRNKHHECLG
jgi:hypothetical protein